MESVLLSWEQSRNESKCQIIEGENWRAERNLSKNLNWRALEVSNEDLNIHP